MCSSARQFPRVYQFPFHQIFSFFISQQFLILQLILTKLSFVSAYPRAPRFVPSASINTFTHLFLGYHKNILIKFHIFRHNDIVSFFYARHTHTTTFDSDLRPDRNTDIKRSPLIIQITHTSSLPAVPARAPLCLLSSPQRRESQLENKGKYFWNYSMRAVSISFRRFTDSSRSSSRPSRHNR